MKDYVKINKFDDCIEFEFYIEEDEIMAVGEKIKKNAPELINTYEVDAEAGMYAATFENSPEGEKAAQAMAEMIISLVEHEDKLIDFVSEFGDEIEWD